MLKLALRLLCPMAALMLLGSCGAPAAPAEDTTRAAPATPPAAAGIPFDHHILVDQFGYRPGDPKVAVVRDPLAGFDSDDRYSPGPTLQVRRAEDGSVVFSGPLSPWREGARDDSSGDTGWWFDFSEVRAAGGYFLFDPRTGVRSAAFRIDEQVYLPVLKAAVRTFFYQRSGYAKQAPSAEACWTDTAAFLGPGQELEARDITDRNNRSKVRNLFGGWFDAGDTNKYVTFASPPVHQLLTALEENPAAFSDDFNIPESGNGVPDLLDELKWEIDWLKRMQFSDGSVALKVGAIGDETAERPGLDRGERFYVPACSSSTIAAAGMFAHAALAYGPYESLARERTELRVRAERAWRHFIAHALQTDCDDGQVKAGDADRSEEDQKGEAVVAAVYLHALTRDKAYADYVTTNLRQAQPFRDSGWSRYNPHQGEALLFHARDSGAEAKTAAAIVAAKRADMESGNGVYTLRPDDNLYRAYLHEAQFHWGSNQVLANYGNSNLDAARLVAGGGDNAYRERAGGILHYFHGVNPFAMVYLSNMYGLGATRSVNEIFHSWYKDGSRWDSATTSACGPPPGFVPGGPNANAAGDGVPTSLKPPTGQPRQKSYRDWNTVWPDAAWSVSEPGIYYQAAYIKLLSGFAQKTADMHARGDVWQHTRQ